jgi:hypothetical protein
METVKFKHKCIIIKIDESTIKERGSVYEAVRCAWSLNTERAKKADYVLAVPTQKQNSMLYPAGVICGVFKAEFWYENNKSEVQQYGGIVRPGHYGFVGSEADNTIKTDYLGKLIPANMQGKKGGSTPVRYTYE